MMPIERKQIIKQYLLLCEGKDAEQFLINYLNSDALSEDQRFSNEIQVFDFGGNSDLSSFLMNLKNMDGFDQVTNIAIIRDAEKDYAKACKEVSGSLRKCGFMSLEQCGAWFNNNALRVGFMFFPLSFHYKTKKSIDKKIIFNKI